MHRTQARFAEVVSWVVGRGLGSTVEYLGSRCAGEQGSLAVSWRGNKQVTTELQIFSARAPRRGGLLGFFFLLSFRLLLFCHCILSFPFPHQLPVGQARLAKGPTSLLSVSPVCLRVSRSCARRPDDRLNEFDVAAGRKALQLSPDLMMNGGGAGAPPMGAKRSCRWILRHPDRQTDRPNGTSSQSSQARRGRRSRGGGTLTPGRVD